MPTQSDVLARATPVTHIEVALDAGLAVGEETSSPRPSGSAVRPRAVVYFELLVTVGLFAIPFTLNSAFIFVNGDAGQSHHATWGFATMAVQELLLIGLLAHIVHMNGETLVVLTKPFSRKDPIRAAGLTLAWLMTSRVVLELASKHGLTNGAIQPDNVEAFRTQLSSAHLVAALVNPFCEELWMRGFLQTRLRQLGWPGVAIVIASAALQSGYHLYQGVPHALALACVFGVFAAFYQATGRLWPVVGAHLMADVLSMLAYAHWR